MYSSGLSWHNLIRGARIAIREYGYCDVCNESLHPHVRHGISVLPGVSLATMLTDEPHLDRMAMWDRKRYIVVPLTVALLGFAGVLLRGIIGVKDIWVEGAGCSIVSSQQTILRTIYIYGMSLDLIVLLLTFYKLGFGSEKSALMNLLLRDGLVYFLIT